MVYFKQAISLSPYMMLKFLKICNINVCSITSKFNEFRDLVRDEFDVIAVSETWLTKDIEDNVIAIKDYQLFRLDRDGRGGGVAAYFRNFLKVNRYLGLPQYTSEQLWLSATIDAKHFAFGFCYRPPRFPVNSFLDELEVNLSILVPKFDDVIILGDLNIDFADYNSVSCKRLSQIMDEHSMKQLVDQATRISLTRASILDVIICTENVIPSNLNVSDGVSDHKFVYCNINNSIIDNKPFLYTYRDYKKFNPVTFLTDLEQVNFQYIFDIADIDGKLLCFNELLLSVYNRHAPIRTVKISRPKAPWITYTIKKMMSLRDRALVRFKKSKLPQHWEYYKQLRNLTKNSIKREKKAYFRFKINRKHDTNFWKELKKLGNFSRHATIPDTLNSPTEINDFFIASSISNTQPNADVLNKYANTTLSPYNNFSFTLTNETEVLKSIMSIKSKAIGADGINIYMLMHACPFILPYIVHIFNACIEGMVFPSLWKKAQIFPLPKTKDPLNYSDLRPVSILCTLSKVFEKIIFSQMYSYLEDKNILPASQSGFRKGHSCATALLKVTDDILSAQDQNKLTLLVLLDYTKAFDRIKHSLLLAILHFVGFHENSVSLIKHYLTDRYQSVAINNVTSDYLKVDNGVPQGSILGPLFFILYTFQFNSVLKYSKSQFYADDTQIYISFSENKLDDTCEKLNEDLNSLTDISNNFCLAVNPTKSNTLLFGRHAMRDRCKHRVNVQIGNEVLPVSDRARNLGIIMDSSLKYSEYVSMIIRRAYCNIKLIYSNRDFFDISTKKLLCDSIVLSHFNYVDVVYGPALSVKDSRRLQLVQNSCIRLVYGLRRSEHISGYMRNLGWLNIAQRRTLHMYCFYHRVIKSKTPQYLYQKIKFRTDIHHINLRHKHQMTIPQHSTALFQSSFSYNVVRLCNRIRFELFSLSAFQFKLKIKTMILDGIIGE